MTVGITGSTGNFGTAFIDSLCSAPDAADKIKLLCRSSQKAKKLLARHKAISNKTEVIYGEITDEAAVREFVKDCDIIFNVCAVIPPTSDRAPRATVACNEVGVKVLLKAIKELERQPVLIHISTVAVYGNRSGDHKYGRVGDPLISSPYELYGATKLRGEYEVLTAHLKRFAVLRQTAMLHHNLFTDNISDGLMFHTCFDSPFEWLSARDSGALLCNILKQFGDGTIPEWFWNKVYNIGGGPSTRVYGYATYDAGFRIIGGSFKRFFMPGYNCTRNFHGMWYTDSDILEELFRFRSQSCDDFWQEMRRVHRIYALGKLVPKSWIEHFAIKRLFKNENAPIYWATSGNKAKLTAYFGSEEKYFELQKKTWDDVELPTEIPDFVPLTYEQKLAHYGYDIDKPDEKITVDDLKSVAAAHGGRLITPEKFDGMYTDLEWETCDGDRFTADTNTVLRAGHWMSPIYKDNVWDYDRLAKTDKIVANIWYDSHDRDEDNVYILDKNFETQIKKLQ